MPDLKIYDADLNEPAHQQAIVDVLDAYAQIPMINGKPLDDQVRRELPQRLAEHPTTHILLASVDGRPAGVAICFVGFSTFAAQPLLNLHDLAVLEAYRGQGVGRQLMAGVVAKAEQLGCCKVTLEVAPENDRALQLYRTAGFKGANSTDQTLFMNKPL